MTSSILKDNCRLFHVFEATCVFSYFKHGLLTEISFTIIETIINKKSEKMVLNLYWLCALKKITLEFLVGRICADLGLDCSLFVKSTKFSGMTELVMTINM